MPYTVLNPALAAAAPAFTGGEPLTSVGETLLTLRDQLKLEMGNRSDISGDPQWNKWINWGYRHLCSMLDLKELDGSVAVAAVADQPLYNLPTSVGFIQTVSVVDTTTYIQGGRRLTQIDREQYRQLEDDEDEPENYFRHGRMLVLWPTPSTARTVVVDFRIRPDDLADDTDSPILPIEFHEALLIAAKYRALRATRQFAAAGAAMNEMVTLIRPITDTDAEERAGMDMSLQPVRHARQIYRNASRRRWL